MTPRQRYRVAFFALGWLIVLGVGLRSGLGAGLRLAYGRLEASLSRFAQSLSDSEGSAWRRARGHSRRSELASLAPMLSSPEKLRHPDRLLFGAYDGDFPNSFERFDRLEAELRYRFPIVSFYSAWGDRPGEQFPTRMVETIDRLGSVPLITWEPWVTDFDPLLRSNLRPAAEREYASLGAIARGDYDFYVVPWAAAAARYSKPLLLRFAHEMNDPYRYPWGPQNGNRTEDFIAAWKHVHAIFEKAAARNILWVWSPHISMPWFEYYYPGPDQVDWIAMGILNYGDAAPWSRWWTFHQILEKAYPSLAKLGKPMLLAEFGTLGSGGDPVQWYSDAFRDLREKYAGIRAVVFFNQSRDTTLTTTPLDWSILQSPRATAFWRGALSKTAPVARN